MLEKSIVHFTYKTKSNCPFIMSLRYLKFRWPWRRGTPLTIPNREVKPVSADGTAIPSGRVGRRLARSPFTLREGAFFMRYIQIAFYYI